MLSETASGSIPKTTGGLQGRRLSAGRDPKPLLPFQVCVANTSSGQLLEAPQIAEPMAPTAAAAARESGWRF